MIPKLAAVYLLVVATATGSIPDHAQQFDAHDVIRVGAAITIYQNQCGTIGSQTQAMIDVLNKLHPNDTDVIAAGMNIFSQISSEGKDAWCSRMKPEMDK